MTIAAHERLRSQGMSDPELPPVGDPIRARKPGEEPEQLSPAEAEAAVIARAAIERLLERFHDRYEADKNERSALDFSDLELRALALLKANPALAASWRARFDHVMVDEFQDTNRVQLDLVEALRGPETKVFMVGDEHQSIYRFRNADLEVFRREREAAAADPERDVLPLLGNFRSRPAVLAAINAVGRALLDGFSELTAGRTPDGGPGAVELLLTLDEGSGREARRWDADGIELDPAPSASPSKVIAEARCAGRAPARAGRVRRRDPGRDRRPAARLHPRRRLRGGARARRPAPVRGGWARLLDPAAGRGPHPAARRGRQPARRRVPVRGARLVRERGQPRRALAAAPGGPRRGRQRAARLAAARVALRRRARTRARRDGVARPHRARGRAAARALLLDRRRAARRGAVADARGAGRADHGRVRLRPRADRPPRRRRAGWQTCAS